MHTVSLRNSKITKPMTTGFLFSFRDLLFYVHTSLNSVPFAPKQLWKWNYCAKLMQKRLKLSWVFKFQTNFLSILRKTFYVIDMLMARIWNMQWKHKRYMYKFIKVSTEAYGVYYFVCCSKSIKLISICRAWNGQNKYRENSF